MALRLVIVEGQAQGTQLRLGQRPAIEVGRSSAADLTILDPALADIHLKIFREGDHYTCFDVTGAGFLHNERKTLKATLEPGDLIRLGSHAIRLLSDSTTDLPSSAPRAPAAPAGCVSLVAVKGNDAGKAFVLGHKNVVILGRGVQTDITIWDIRASRAHCRIDRLANGYQISDLNSSNGTSVNGKRIKTHALEDGDLVRIGSTVLRFVDNGGKGPPGA